MTDQASFNDGGSPVDHQCELPTILSLQALDGLSAPESYIQAVPETAEAGAPMNRDLRNCCDPYLNHAQMDRIGRPGSPQVNRGCDIVPSLAEHLWRAAERRNHRRGRSHGSTRAPDASGGAAARPRDSLSAQSSSRSLCRSAALRRQ